jgi:hypothetical protein
MSSCCVCNKRVTKSSPGIQCSGQCRKFYHQICASISSESFAILSGENGIVWTCSLCSKKQRKSIIITNDTASPSSSLASSQTELNQNNSASDVAAEFSAVRGSIVKLSACIAELTSKFDNLEEKFNLIDKLEAENSELKKEVTFLKSKVEVLSAKDRSRKIEIKGIPSNKKVNVFTIASKIAEQITCELDIKDIDNIYRVHSDGSIVLEFVSYLKKSEFLFASKKNLLNNELLGIESDVRFVIYVNELLSRKAKYLIKKGRDLRRAGKIFSIRSENGIVLCKKFMKSRPVRIFEETDYLSLEEL